MPRIDARIYILSLIIAAAVIVYLVVFVLHMGQHNVGNGPINFNSSSNSSCPYGYVCGIESDGCAVQGAIYNCSFEQANPTPNNSSGIIAIDLAKEMSNSAEAGFNLNESVFYANSSSDCVKQLISACDNNAPTQFICVNKQYAAAVSSQYGNIYSTIGACPMFVEAGTISCGLDGNYCVIIQTRTY